MRRDRPKRGAECYFPFKVVSIPHQDAYYFHMSASQNLEASGPFDARYLAFLATVTQLRPRLHRYCARMSGSVMDREDIVQEALFGAYRKLDGFDDSRPLTPWLFRIAHNRCIDFLRRRRVRTQAEAEAISDMPEFAPRAAWARRRPGRRISSTNPSPARARLPFAERRL